MKSLLIRTAELLRVTLLFGWIARVVTLLRALCRKRPDRHLRERERRASRSPCVPIDDPAYIRPDPLIYSQDKLMALGLAVTWDNPDVQMFQAGTPVGSYNLTPSTPYDVRIRVWNNSFDCPVVNMPVHLSYASAGVGPAGQLIGTAKVDVGVKATPTQPGFCTIPWTTPPGVGHYCLKVLLDPVVDVDVSNNVGQENTQVGKAASPATFQFVLRNDDRIRHGYRFVPDAYEVGRRPLCDGEDDKDHDRHEERHKHGGHPVPTGWTVSCVPDHPVLAPGDQVTITVEIEPPPGWTGSQTVNVNVFHEHGLAGGMTFVVTR